MAWFTGSVVFVLIWWTLLFAVLPSPNSAPDPVSGWRGMALFHSGWIGFRHGLLAMPSGKG